MLNGAPKPEEVLGNFCDFLGDACLVAHNISFDTKFLNHELSLIGKERLSNIVMFDTLQMARQLLPELSRHSLLAVAHFLDVGDSQEHRAMSDVVLTYNVFVKLLEFADRKDINTMDTLFSLCGYPREPLASRRRR